MVLHMDDHLVHRGHGVFDTAVISEVRRQRRAPSSAGHHPHTGVLAGDIRACPAGQLESDATDAGVCGRAGLPVSAGRPLGALLHQREQGGLEASVLGSTDPAHHPGNSCSGQENDRCADRPQELRPHVPHSTRSQPRSLQGLCATGSALGAVASACRPRSASRPASMSWPTRRRRTQTSRCAAGASRRLPCRSSTPTLQRSSPTTTWPTCWRSWTLRPAATTRSGGLPCMCALHAGQSAARPLKWRQTTQAVFVDEAGFVAEGTTMNLGVITHDGEVVIPPFEQSLAGCTARRLMKVIAEVLVPPLTPCCTSEVCVCP
jgi:hypothetical protein